MESNATSVHNVSDGCDDWNANQVLTDGQVRSSRASNMSSSGMNSDRSRGSHSNSMGKGFGTGKTSWNSNIWGDSNLGGGFGDGTCLLDFENVMIVLTIRSRPTHQRDRV